MKKVSLLLVAIAGLLLAGCQQEIPVVNPDALQDVVFSVGLKNTDLKGDDQIDCAFNADYAVVMLGDEQGDPLKDEDGKDRDPVILPIQIMGDLIYTSTLKIPVGEYTILGFILMQQTGSEPNIDQDVVLSASPNQGSEFSLLVDFPIGMPLTIQAFEKTEIPVDVICYYPADYDKFGFTWFKLNLTTVREGVFFGDLCSGNYEAYKSSAYGQYAKFDMPAIFRLELSLKNDQGQYELVETFSNEDLLVADALGNQSIPPLKVTYKDADDVDEQYKMDIYVYQMENDVYGDPISGQFSFQKEDTWYFVNHMGILYSEEGEQGESFDAGKDGVYDFVAGECEVVEFDIDLDDPGDPEDPTDEDCAPCKGGVISLTVAFDGLQAAEIEVINDGETLFGPSTVQPGGLIQVEGTKDDGKFESNDVKFYVAGQLDTKIHVSCSKPVNPGLSFGLFTITEAISKDNGLICPFDTEDGPLANAETAFAYYNSTDSECFLNIPGVNSNRWGWTNTIQATSGNYELDLIAGAGQCNQEAGTKVGVVKIEVKVEDGKAYVDKVKYEMDGDYKLYEVHVYFGSDILPIKNNSYTVAPGQYPYGFTGIDKEDKFEIREGNEYDRVYLTDTSFYLIAHAVVK